jgi:hypothetical protein
MLLSIYTRTHLNIESIYMRTKNRTTPSKNRIRYWTKNNIHFGLKIAYIGLKIGCPLYAPMSSFKNIEAVLRFRLQNKRNIETMPRET